MSPKSTNANINDRFCNETQLLNIYILYHTEGEARGVFDGHPKYQFRPTYIPVPQTVIRANPTPSHTYSECPRLLAAFLLSFRISILRKSLKSRRLTLLTVFVVV